MRRIRAQKPTTLRPTRANAGIKEAYRAALDKIIREMQDDVKKELHRIYKKNEPRIIALAEDAIPSSELSAAVRAMARRWQKRFANFAPEMATKFAHTSRGYTDTNFRKALKQSGFTVQFQMSAPMRDAYNAVVAENVGLIKSIPAQYFTEIEGMVMRSVQHGGDLGRLSKELQLRYGVTRRRAALIARDQNNKATAVMTRVRQQEIGITEALWMHSHAGKHPRPSHVAADGKKYTISEGMLIEGERIWPGEKINCRCFAKSIVPGLS